MKINLDFMPKQLKRWLPPLIVIPAMLALGYWGGETARFFLFTHHIFWFVGITLLIFPVSETLWPSSKSPKRQPPLAKTKSQRRREARQRRAEQKPMLNTETPTERLARLRRQKEEVDRKIEKLSD
jgi:hypothetical protein